MRFRVLGPLRVRHGAVWSTVNAPQQRLVLAVLLIENGRVVTTDRLADEIWGDRPPRAAVGAIQNYVLRLRRWLGDEAGRRLVTRQGGYELVVADDDVDTGRFERLARLGRASLAGGRADAAAARLGDALGLWRGAVLADVTPTASVAAEVARLERLRLAVTEDRLEAELQLGHHHEVVEDLRSLAEAEPFRERLHGQLMLALFRCGRRAEALDAYRRVRARLIEELGLEPGQRIRDLHRAILADDDAPPGVTPTTVRVIPAQLPPDVAAFTGRRGQVRRLDALLTGPAGRSPALRIATITGTAGVGKTALALHWAHRVRDRYPDGQLFIDLRGHADHPPVTPIEALARSLVALGVPSEQIPSDVDAAAAQYRSLLADRRLLVLLDNAGHPDQVRPLLPGSPGCAVLVTSRDQLRGLVARDGAVRVHLTLLRPAEAGALMARLLGRPRVEAEPHAVAELARLCDYLPLALRVAAANLTGHIGQTVAGYVAELAGQDRLGALQLSGDPRSAIRAAFDLSYTALSPDGRRLFRLLGTLPGPDATAPAVAALAGLPLRPAGAILDELLAAHLVDERVPGRFGLHDLLRLYAAEQARAEETGTDRRTALARLGWHYLCHATAAVQRLYPLTLRLPLPRPCPESLFEDDAQALAWLDAERPNLVAAIQRAAEHGPRPAAWRLADALRGYFFLRLPFVDWDTVAHAAQHAARSAHDPRARAAAHFSLAMLHGLQARYAEAVDHQMKGLTLSRRAGWTEGEGAALCNLGLVYWALGRLPEAVEHFERSLTLVDQSRWPLHTAANYNNLGLALSGLGRFAEAEDHHVRALRLYRREGWRGGEAQALGRLGETRRRLGRLDEATADLTRALAVNREVGDRMAEVTVIVSLALTYRDAGRCPEALAFAAEAARLTAGIGDARLEAESAIGLASVRTALGDHERADEGYGRALDLARATGNRYVEAVALVGRADARRRAGDRDRAVQHAVAALDLARSAGFAAVAADAETILVSTAG